jgi:3-oxoacyl-[acyl-carrier protein] reductase
MDQQLKGKRALVTGGSRGIGAAIVKRLARDGAHVALTYVSKPDEAHKTAAAAGALGVRALAIQADAADPEAVVAAVERTVKEFGGIDILVNSAGIALMAPIDTFSLKDFDRTFAVNVRAVFVATQAAGLARDLGPRGITINNVQPGPVDTDMNPADGDFATTLKQLMALPRYGHVDEIAAMVAYLAGPEAGFVTGASLTIDGGFTA